MVDQWILKILLFPVAVLYGIIIAIRNGLYNSGLLRGVTFSIPVISIGNLSVGGTGKTPHTEYLLRVLHEYIKIGILSRGYRRKTSGYLEITPFLDATQAGDEPLQFKRKFPQIPVAVAESRSLAIPLLIRSYPDLQLLLLDDGFQHREVNAGLNILLTDYNKLYTRDWLLPVGTLREWRNGAKRAEMIIVTKCPIDITEKEINDITHEVRQGDEQKVFFSHYAYGNPYKMYNAGDRIALHENLNVLLVTGIADTSYLMEYLQSKCSEVRQLEFNDHHQFSDSDIQDIKRNLEDLPSGQQRIVLTTEKDAMRLDVYRELLQTLDLPLYLLPVRVVFHGETTELFDHEIKDWLLNFKR
ncbi:MAG TPA: tetraacyldisaccharide 4'-kinase [Saprospiraceae bacterium]|nr:tetraacyldisaccharide 4'-kinase [Saprospiraceae bacterium]